MSIIPTAVFSSHAALNRARSFTSQVMGDACFSLLFIAEDHLRPALWQVLSVSTQSAGTCRNSSLVRARDMTAGPLCYRSDDQIVRPPSLQFSVLSVSLHRDQICYSGQLAL